MLVFEHLQCNTHLHPLMNSVGIEHPQHFAGLFLLSGDYQQAWVLIWKEILHVLA